MVYQSDCRYLPYSIHFSELMPIFFTINTKILEVCYFRMIHRCAKVCGLFFLDADWLGRQTLITWHQSVTRKTWPVLESKITAYMKDALYAEKIIILHIVSEIENRIKLNGKEGWNRWESKEGPANRYTPEKKWNSPNQLLHLYIVVI